MLTISKARVLHGLSLFLALAFTGCTTQPPPGADQINTVLSAPDRSSADKDNDTRRKASDSRTASPNG
jgi:hypothetical protein